MDALPEDTERLAKFAAIEAEFQKEMDDDFNAANGMTVLYQWLKEWNVYLEQRSGFKSGTRSAPLKSNGSIWNLRYR